MIKTYITPQLSAINIDSEISLRLTTAPDPDSGVVLEPGSGGAGLGGENNGSGETTWERTGVGNFESKDPFSSNIWE